MSVYVRVPRAVFQTYWHKPWAEVVAAAESQEDGLASEAPSETPWPWKDGGPQRDRFPAGPDGEVMFAKKQAQYERGNNAAYLREGDGKWGKNRSCLYQQNW